MKALRQLSIILICFTLLSACGRDEQEGLTRRLERQAKPVELVLTEDGRPDPSVLAARQVLHRDNGEEPATLDPHLAAGGRASDILRDLFEGLTAEAPSGRIVPGAAIRWNISRDGKTYTFYLRRDAFWSNGDPVTAEDFVYGLRRSAAPSTAASFAEALLPIANAAEVLSGTMTLDQLGVVAIDKHILQINLNGPTPYFLGLLNHPSTFPVHRPSVSQHGSAFSRPGNLVSNGAYILKDWVLRSRIELVKNEYFRDADNVIIDQVFYYPFEDQSAASKQFRSGELQWTFGVPNNQFKWLQKHYPDELVISPWLGSFFFGFNVSREPFIRNPELRLALAMALDRDLLTEKVTQFGEQPSYTLVPPGIGEFVSPMPEWADWSQAEKNEEARRLYADAGYSEDRPLRIEIRYTNGVNNKKMALAAASLWKQVLGVRATLFNEEFKVFLQTREQKVLTQVFQAGWVSGYADPYSFLEMFRSDHGRNDYGYSNAMFDSLMDQIASERIPARRRRLMFEAERILLEGMPFIPVYTYVTKRLVSPRLKGWESNIMDHHYSKNMFLLKLALEQEAEIVETPDKVVEPEAEETELEEIVVETLKITPADVDAILVEKETVISGEETILEEVDLPERVVEPEADGTPADKMPADETPADETSAGETVQDEVPAQELPTEDTPTEEKPEDDGGVAETDG